MTREEEINKKALSEYPIKKRENKKGIGVYDANLYKRNAFKDGVKWADKTMIEKFEQFLRQNNKGQLIGRFNRFLEE